MTVSREYVTAETARRTALRVRPPGTVIFPKRGGAIATGKKRVLTAPAAFDLNTMGLIPGDRLDTGYLLTWLETVDLAALSDGSNVLQINHGDVAPLTLPLPPLEEQRRIVAEVERQLSLVDALAAAVDAALRRSAALRRAILERAFAGELVPQDPSDEPASVLLERIAAERAANPTRRRPSATPSR
jgi:type I restriction enzyme, S subunit